MTQYDISKIKQVVVWASEGLDVNPLELESKIDVVLYDGITTKEIQNNLITHALDLTTIDSPDWRFVAGRMHIMGLWKNLDSNKARTFVDYIYDMINEGKYTDSFLVHYNETQLMTAGEYIKRERDLDYDYAGALKLTKNYLLDGESPQQMYMAIALLLATVETRNTRMSKAMDIYDAISLRKISLATPFLSNLRKPNGNLSSCFIMGVEDSLESITNSWKDMSFISKNGGGIGVNISKMRSNGSYIQNMPGTASGVVPFIKVVNDIAVYVNQLGSRVAAITLSLDVWHRDIEDLLKIQHENRDPRLTAFDIFPQVIVNDVFMSRAEYDLPWTLMDPKEVMDVTGIDLTELWGSDFEAFYTEWEFSPLLTLNRSVSARSIVKEIMKSWIETGLPYIAFKDTINEANPNKHAGYIPATNLCIESFSNVEAGMTSHVCNLSSLNVSDMQDDETAYYSRLAVRILDNAIDLTDFPTPASALHNDMYRVIGVGVMGLADWLAKRDLTYYRTDEISDLMEEISYNTIVESTILSKERGSYGLFEGSDWDNGDQVDKYANKSRRPIDWLKLQDEIDKYGIRNSQLMAIAPNTSTSLMQGCSSSILPVYAKIFFDTNSSGTFPIVAKHIKEHMWSYMEYKRMDNMKMNSVIESIQQWIDTGISYESVFDMSRDIDAKYMFDFFIDAWKKDIKALYYTRIIGKDGSMRDKEECSSCAG